MSEHDTRGRRLAAAALSLLIPGAGHVLRHRLTRGLIWFGVIAVGFLTLVWTGPLGFLATMVVHFLAVPIDSAWCRRGDHVPGPSGLVWGGGMVVVMIGLGLLVRSRMIEALKVPSASMLPTLEIGDYFYIDKLATDVAVGDVVVHREPRTGRDFVRRVVGVAGERVAIRKGALYRNGVAVPRGPVTRCTTHDRDEQIGTWEASENECAEETLGGHRYTVVVDDEVDDGDDFSERHDFPVDDDRDDELVRPRANGVVNGEYVVPAGHLFLMGDNRVNSFDSRAQGAFPASTVRGTALYVWMSRGPDGIRWGRLGHVIR